MNSSILIWCCRKDTSSKKIYLLLVGSGHFLPLPVTKRLAVCSLFALKNGFKKKEVELVVCLTKATASGERDKSQGGKEYGMICVVVASSPE